MNFYLGKEEKQKRRELELHDPADQPFEVLRFREGRQDRMVFRLP